MKQCGYDLAALFWCIGEGLYADPSHVSTIPLWYIRMDDYSYCVATVCPTTAYLGDYLGDHPSVDYISTLTGNQFNSVVHLFLHAVNS